jgi:DNA invertase Pin-like site-specific DNA recombinase
MTVGEFVDSGGKGDADRPGLSRVLIDARHGRYDILLVYALDRLTRAIREAAHVFDELDQAGVLVLSATDVVDATSLGNRTWPFIRVDTVARQGSEVQILAESPTPRSWRKR